MVGVSDGLAQHEVRIGELKHQLEWDKTRGVGVCAMQLQRAIFSMSHTHHSRFSSQATRAHVSIARAQ